MAEDESVTHDDDLVLQWVDRFEMVKCLGCETVALRHVSGWVDAPDDMTIITYPPPMARRVPLWLSPVRLPVENHIPQLIHDLMRETYTAVQNNSRRLAAMGVRATLEAVMVEKVGDFHSFAANLDKFKGAGYISERQLDVLTSILEAGHAAIHRAWEPSAEDISKLLDVAESIIASVYLHEKQAEELMANVPKRRR
ncbi:DUF4145 domain-containing protein [Methylosinus sp. PW1]|uniref:DUF4145 domain-containing protein n=1 Tax=Methylosinus sp. PW1 TaxID=107636 RepID=UPI0018DD4475|nr:DUF4145 domain-containing protein [Methylosinus sp. PW1]